MNQQKQPVNMPQDPQQMLRFAQSLLNNAQRPQLHVLAVLKELELTDKELERSHASLQIAIEKASPGVADLLLRIKDLKLSLELAIMRYQKLAQEEHNATQIKSTPKESLVHPVDGEKCGLAASGDEEKEF